ncbi:MAG: ketoacyl-ACP synthase III [Bdellovibrionales bacterium]|nr:ketoacyl-ACP synthase III [Bdellovibrionales bacterium]
MPGLYNSKIISTGSYLPEKILTNFDLEKMVDTSDQWISERTGIKSRHVAAPDQATSDLAYEAAKIAMKDAGLTGKDLDAIIVATITPDSAMPSTACILQAKLDAVPCMALDVSAACSGFVYAFSIADQFIRTGSYKNILLVGGEVLTRIVNYKDRDTCILFGDGAGACVIQRTPEGEQSRVFSHHLHADGDLGELFVQPAGGSRLPLSQEVLDKNLQFVTMRGREIFKHAVRTMSRACEEALKANDMSPKDVSWIIPHQANIRIIEAVAKHFGISMDHVLVEIADMGNTSAATVITAMDRAIRDGRIQRGQNIILTAFGAGITSGSLIMRY